MPLSPDQLLRHSVVLVGAGALTSALNYAYQVLTARMLGPRDFGFLGPVLALVASLRGIEQPLQLSIAGFVSTLQAESGALSARPAIAWISKRVVLVAFIGAMALAAGSPSAARAMQLPSATPLLLVAAGIPLWWLWSALAGSLQGLQRFAARGGVDAGGAAAKVVFGVVLIALGWGVAGALVGSLLGAATAVLGGRLAVRRLQNPPGGSPETRGWGAKLAWSALPSGVALVLLTLMYSVDVLAVGQYFPPQETGLYAASSTLAKAVLFIGLPVSYAMFPKVIARNAQGEREHARRLLMACLAYTTALAGCGAALLSVLSGNVVQILLGSAYVDTSGVVPRLSIALVMVSVCQVLTLYELAVGRRQALLVLLVGFCLEVIGLVRFHGTLSAVADVVIAAATAVLVGLACVVGIGWLRPAEKKESLG